MSRRLRKTTLSYPHSQDLIGLFDNKVMAYRRRCLTYTVESIELHLHKITFPYIRAK